MKTRTAILGALALTIGILPIETRAIDISSGEASRAQRFEAWGTSLAWWANGVGGWNDADSRDELVQRMFDQENGLGLNYARYNVGGGQNRLYAGNFRPGALVPGWVPAAPTSVTDSSTWQWNWDADPNQRRVLEAALDSGVTRVDAISYSAPYWMTVSQDTGGGPGGAPNLPSDAAADALAEYQSEVVRHFYENLDVRFQAFSPINEPSANYWVAGGRQEGMRVPPGYDQRYILEKTGEALNAKGVPVGIAAAEEFSASLTVNSFNEFNNYTQSFIAQINTHVYGGGGSNPNSSLDAIRNLAESNDLRLYQSEYGNNSTTDLSGGIGLADRITQDVNRMGVNGWAYWQVVEPTSLSGAGWGLAWAGYNPNDSGYEIRKQYHVMRQFSGHIRPGSHILSTSDTDTVAAYDPSTETTTLVYTNQTGNTVAKQYDLLDGDPAFTRHIHTTATDDYVSLGAPTQAGAAVSFTAEGPSVSTLVIHHRPNLVSNATVEAGAPGNGTPLGWQVDGDARFSSLGSFGGVVELRADAAGNEGSVWQAGIGDAGADLTGVAFQLSADALFQEHLLSNYDAKTTLGLEFYGADGQTLAHASPQDFATEIDPAAEDSEWRTYRTPTVLAPAGTRYVRPVASFTDVSNFSNESVFLDNFYLQEVQYQPRGGHWTTNGGGEISDASNWDFDARESENAHLVLGDVNSQPATLTVGADATAASLTLDSEQPYRLLGQGSLVLEADADATALLDARRGDHPILIDIQLITDTTLRALPDASLTVTGMVDADGIDVSKLGAGVITLAGGISLTGGSLDLYAASEASLVLGPQSVLDGSLDVLLTPGHVPGAGEAFELVRYSGTIVQFDAVNLPALATGLDWSFEYAGSSLTATVIAATTPGDFNADGKVDSLDYTIWRDTLGQAVPIRSGADADGDGVIDENDYALWVSNFGTAAGELAAVVPEPTLWPLLIWMLLARGVPR